MGHKDDKSTMKYIIMAGGDYTKWETPKQLTVINGEPLIARTIRLLREAGVTDIAISTNNPVFKQFGIPLLHHKNDFVTDGSENCTGFWVDCFYPTGKPACYIFGDVYFSPEAIKTIVGYKTKDVMLFGSKPPFADDYPKVWREPFAFKVANQQRFRQGIEETKSLCIAGVFNRHPIAWQLWNVLCHTPPNRKNGTYHVINDYTCDIDSPNDIEKLGGR